MVTSCTSTSTSGKGGDGKLESIQILQDEGNEVIDGHAKLECLASGFTWVEGPCYVPEGYLLFSDIPENKVYKWSDSSGIEDYLIPSGFTGLYAGGYESGSNGLLLNHRGELILCQHGDRRLAIMKSSLSDPRPEFETIVDSFNGHRLNSPNDAVYHSNGDLFFTDPPYGLNEYLDDENKELEFQGVYRLDRKGDLILLDDRLRFPNGIALSPDNTTLYVANSDVDDLIWMAYVLDSAGNVTNRRVFYDANTYRGRPELGNPDGMTVNSQGYIFATGPEGVWIFNKEGEVLARIYTGRLTSNCTLSNNEKYLYMTAHDRLLRVALK